MTKWGSINVLDYNMIKKIINMEKRTNQEEVWDKIAKPWQKCRAEPKKEVLDFLSGKQGNLLDLCCGSGRHFARWNGTIYGVDFSKEMLALAESYAKRKNFNVILKKANADSLPFEDNFFDSAIFIAGLHCIDSSEKRKKAVRELFRVLKPKSRALITVWSRSHERIKNKPKEAMIPWTAGKKKHMRYYYIFDKDELAELLKSAGFNIISISEDDNISVIAEKPALDYN